MRSLISQLRYTIRLLLKSPEFTVTAVLILGFGIGLNTAIFSLISTIILRPPPFPESERLVELFTPFQNMEFMPFDYPDYEDVSAAQHSLEMLAVYTWEDMNLNVHGEAQRIGGSFVSANMFNLTGLPLVLGRSFTAEDDKSGGPAVVVLGEKFWRTRFDADPSIIGTTLMVNGRSFDVIGVAPGQAFALSQTDVYIPIHSMRAVDFQNREQHYFLCIGRLKKGVSVSEARVELTAIHSRLIDRYPGEEKGYGISIAPLLSGVRKFYSPTVWLLGAAVGCLFLIAAANIINLILARAFERRREIAIRTALGATNSRIASQLLLESLVLSGLGAGLGLLVAGVAVDIIRQLCPHDEWSRFDEVGLDGVTLLFFTGVTLFSSLLFALFPAWNLTRRKPAAALRDEKGSASTSGSQRQRTTAGLVTVQIAFACILIVATSLLTRSFQATQAVALGFRPDHVLTAQIYLSSNRYALGPAVGPAATAANRVKINSFFDTLLDRARQLPGVTAVAVNNAPPFFDFGADPFFAPDDLDAGKDPVCATQTISLDYFRTLEIPLFQGRTFGPEDQADSQRVVIIDEAMAQHCFPNQSPIGRRIAFGGEIAGYGKLECTVVGVVQTVRVSPPDEPQPKYEAYFPRTQTASNSQVLILRSTTDPRTQILAVHKLVASIDPDVLVFRTVTMYDVIGAWFAARRMGVLLVNLFSGSALLLSAIGLYGVLAYAVNQRRHEIGVRIALGAPATNILWLVIRHGLTIVGTGLVIGILSSLLLSRYIQSLLFGVSSNDPISFALAISTLAVSGLLACLLPGLRAMRTNPITALRE
jgi:putative ABC transport system permease protein